MVYIILSKEAQVCAFSTKDSAKGKLSIDLNKPNFVHGPVTDIITWINSTTVTLEFMAPFLVFGWHNIANGTNIEFRFFFSYEIMWMFFPQ